MQNTKFRIYIDIYKILQKIKKEREGYRTHATIQKSGLMSYDCH